MTARVRILLAATLLALVATAPAATAQTPEPPHVEAEYLQAGIALAQGFVEVEWKGQAFVPFTVTDRSVDRLGESGFPHLVTITPRIVTPGVSGWAVSASPSGGITKAGDTLEGNILVQAGPATQLSHITVVVEMEMQGYGSSEPIRDTATLQVRLAPYHLGLIYINSPPPQLEPYEVHRLPLDVANFGPYPDTFAINATVPDGWTVSVPPRVTLLPGETRTIHATIVAPHDKYYYWTESVVYTFHIRSALDPTDPAITKPYVATVNGAYVPGYTKPVGVLFLFLLGAAAAQGLERRDRSRKEHGPPRKPKPTPRQQVLLKELKRRNPDAYRAKKAELAAVYAQRKRTYKVLKKTRQKRERLLKEKARREAAKRKAERQKREKARKEAEKRLEKLRKEKEKRHKGLLAAKRKKEKRAEKRRRKQAKKLQKRREREAKRRARRERPGPLARFKAWRKRRAEAKKRKRLQKLEAKKRKRLEKLKAKKRAELKKKRKALEKARKRKGDR